MIEYDSCGRMKYNPDFHGKHGTDWLASDEKYLIDNYDLRGTEQMSFALERTMSTLSERVRQLRKAGKMPKFRAGLKKGNKRGSRA